MYSIIYYWNARGDLPVKEFIASLPVKAGLKIFASLNLLEREGPALRRPYADKVRGSIRELRVRLGPDQMRILYAFALRDKIILLHGFRKKTNALPEKDIVLAEKRLKDFLVNHEEA